MLLKLVKKYMDLKAFQEDLRKLGINLMTAGMVGLFITHIADITFWVKCASLVVFISGVLVSGFGLFKRGG